MVILGYFTHFHESALCYTDVHVYHATSLKANKLSLNLSKINFVFPSKAKENNY